MKTILSSQSSHVARRKQLAARAFQSMFSLWKRRDIISEHLRIRLYNAFVLPILLYNCGTRALTTTGEARLALFHRSELRNLLGISWPRKINNRALYERCTVDTTSQVIKAARWRLFAHLLRLVDECPAVMAMESYFHVQASP